MPRNSDKRDKLIRAADALFHRRGFERSTIADVAETASVPLGNVYYYFKSKDDLVLAVTEFRNAQGLLRRGILDRLPSPRERVLGFVARFDALIESRTAHGCPTGGLCLETSKIGGAVAESAAVALRESLAWLACQLAEMGLKPKAAKAGAAQIVGGLQGAILLANTFKDGEFMRVEIRRLKDWIAGLAEPSAKRTAVGPGTPKRKTSK